MEVSVEGRPSVSYWGATKSATYGFIAALPLFLLYEVLILLVNGGRANQIRVGADVWIKQLLSVFGSYAMTALAILVLMIGVTVFVHERKKKIPIRFNFLGWLIGESAVYAIIVAFLVSAVVGLIFSMDLGSLHVGMVQGQEAEAPGMFMMVVLSIGAGLYEELIFRVVLVGSLSWVLYHWMGNKTAAYVVSALVGALIFSAVHYVGALGDAFTLSSFTFRFLFGLALNGIFLVRGFGVAAWTHALYDVLVVTHLLG